MKKIFLIVVLAFSWANIGQAVTDSGSGLEEKGHICFDPTYDGFFGLVYDEYGCNLAAEICAGACVEVCTDYRVYRCVNRCEEHRRRCIREVNGE